MAKRLKSKSLSRVAKLDDPFCDTTALIRLLTAAKAESRHVEWKSMPPFGPAVTTKTKYRVVKALLAFANTDGGFVIFGISPDGKWTGFNKAELDTTDPAMLVELINSCVLPEINGLNYTTIQRRGRWFALLHTPPSPLVPHVTTKEVVEHAPDRRVLLSKGAVFCRYGAKCDLATAAQFARMIDKRTAFLKGEMLRRIRQVEVPIPSTKSSSQNASPTMLRITAASNTSAAPVRVTRDRSEASGMLVYEELDTAIFDEINNVIAAGKLISSHEDFVFDEKIYHRIYAERQHVVGDADYNLLARVAVTKFYAPMTFWATKLPPRSIADLLQVIPFSSKSPHFRLLSKLAFLLGDVVVDWMAQGLERAWKNYTQPPEHLFAFRKMLANRGGDPRLSALQLTERASLPVPGENKSMSVKDLLSRPQDAAGFLSRACMEVFNGDGDWRWASRQFDLLAYGLDVGGNAAKVASFLGAG